jgi:pSer/pThr/pTyr-binding forkhead associated (FHA) protein
MQTVLIAAIAALLLASAVLAAIALIPHRKTDPSRTAVAAPSAVNLRQPFHTTLRLRSINLPSQEIVNITREDFLIGRDAGCDFVLDRDLGISNQHCRILYKAQDAAHYIVDLDSENHTYLGGKLLEPMREYRLEKGSIVTIVSWDFIVESAFKA